MANDHTSGSGMMQALILAGGAGTRLRSVLGESLNKPMAPIANRPFLEYLITHLREQNIVDIVLCVGYHADLIQSYFGAGERWGVSVTYSRESDYLGTGGAVKLAEDLIQGEDFLVLNGDSFFDVNVRAMGRFHRTVGAAATLALARVEDAGRFGVARIDDQQAVVGFTEKTGAAEPGLINGGVYVLRREVLRLMPRGSACSLERDVFPALVGHGLYGYPSAGYFIDIGVPADYRRLEADPPLVLMGGARKGEGKERGTC